MSRPAEPSAVDEPTIDWDDPSLWSERARAERFSFGGSSARDVALSIAIVVLPIVALLAFVSLLGLGDAGSAGGGV